MCKSSQQKSAGGAIPPLPLTHGGETCSGLLQGSPIHLPPCSSEEHRFKLVKSWNDSQPLSSALDTPQAFMPQLFTENKNGIRAEVCCTERQKGTHSKRGEEGKNPPLPSQSHSQGQQLSLYKTLALFLIWIFHSFQLLVLVMLFLDRLKSPLVPDICSL